MADYITELRRVVERERRVLEAMSNCGTPAHIVAIQRERFNSIAAQAEELTDYYSLSADHGASV